MDVYAQSAVVVGPTRLDTWATAGLGRPYWGRVSEDIHFLFKL
jgi:hypothetical protein